MNGHPFYHHVFRRTSWRAAKATKPMRAGFTLIELLVVTLIIITLASITLFTLAGVQEQAREARTRAQIERLHDLLMEKYESYRTRPVPINIPRGVSAQVAGQLRVRALHELMRMEMPDRITDITDDPVVLTSVPSLARRYRRMINNTNFLTTREHQNAECLYMIVASINDGDTNGLEFFSENEVGDTDQDGVPEILDAWGTPINFIRWAPAFESDLQGYALDPITGNPSQRPPDPLDPLKSDLRYWPVAQGGNNDPSNPSTVLDDPFPLFPLIFSAGPDRFYGVVWTDFDSNRNNLDIHYSQTNQAAYHDPARPPGWPAPPWNPPNTTRPPNDPHMILPTSGDRIGRTFANNNGSGSADDNIHNHLFDVR